MHDIIIIIHGTFYDFRDLREIPLIPRKRGEKGRETERHYRLGFRGNQFVYANVRRCPRGDVSFFATVLSFVIKCQASSSLKNPFLSLPPPTPFLCNMRKVRAYTSAEEQVRKSSLTGFKFTVSFAHEKGPLTKQRPVNPGPFQPPFPPPS